MPSIQSNNEDYGVRLGVGKRIAIEKLDNEMKKIAESLKQRGIPTVLTDPKLLDEALAAFHPKVPLSPLPLDLRGRNLNGTKKPPAARSSAARPSSPQTLVELLDRALLPSGLRLESLDGRDLQQIAAWQPKPWFGQRSRSPGAEGGQAPAGASRKLSARHSSKKPKLEPLQRLSRELEAIPAPAARNLQRPSLELEATPAPAARNLGPLQRPSWEQEATPAPAARNLGEGRRASVNSHPPLLPPLVRHASVSPQPQKLAA